MKRRLPSMRATMRLWRRHPVLVSAFAVMVALALVFALRFAVSVAYWSDPARRDLVIEAWMPVGHIARTWDIPRDVLAEALGLPPGSAPGQSLARIAADQGVSVEDIKARLALAIAAHRQALQEGGTDE